MKKLFYLLLVPVCAAIVSCKKEKPTVQIEVTDRANNSPINGARVVVYKCGTFNCYFGTIDLFSGSTDNNGTCKVPANAYNEAAYVRIEKANYWAFDDAKNTSKPIIPAGWIRLHILTTKNYPPQSTLHISITSQLTNSAGSAFQVSNIFNAATDSSVLMKAFGSQSNKIEWQVYDPNNVVIGGTWNQQVPRLDTVNANLNY